MMGRATTSPAHADLFRAVRVQPRGPTVMALQRAIAPGELAPTTDLDLAMHIIQGPFISKRIVDNSDINSDELETMVDMAIRALEQSHQFYIIRSLVNCPGTSKSLASSRIQRSKHQGMKTGARNHNIVRWTDD